MEDADILYNKKDIQTNYKEWAEDHFDSKSYERELPIKEKIIIQEQEVEFAVEQLSKGKAAGPDQVTDQIFDKKNYIQMRIDGIKFQDWKPLNMEYYS